MRRSLPASVGINRAEDGVPEVFRGGLFVAIDPSAGGESDTYPERVATVSAQLRGDGARVPGDSSLIGRARSAEFLRISRVAYAAFVALE